MDLRSQSGLRCSTSSRCCCLGVVSASPRRRLGSPPATRRQQRQQHGLVKATPGDRRSGQSEGDSLLTYAEVEQIARNRHVAGCLAPARTYAAPEPLSTACGTKVCPFGFPRHCFFAAAQLSRALVGAVPSGPGSGAGPAQRLPAQHCPSRHPYSHALTQQSIAHTHTLLAMHSA